MMPENNDTANMSTCKQRQYTRIGGNHWRQCFKLSTNALKLVALFSMVETGIKKKNTRPAATKQPNTTK